MRLTSETGKNGMFGQLQDTSAGSYQSHETSYSAGLSRGTSTPRKDWEPGCLVGGKGARGEEDWGGRCATNQVTNGTDGSWRAFLRVSASWAGDGDWGRGLGTGAHRGGGGLPFRPCFGPHSASPTTSPGLRRPAPAPPGPATPLRRPRASLTEAAQVLLSFETGRGSVPALQPAGKRRPKRTSAATATATAAATVTSSSRSSDSRVAAALRKNRPPLPHCTACLAVT
jgi:hypothetical protein